MITVAKMGGGRESYYATLGKTDYYAGEKLSLEPAGVWIGKGAEHRQVNIAGNLIEQETLKNLLRGYDPEGSRGLVYNAGKFDGTKRDRMPGFDMTFSAMKSASICWAVGNEEIRRGIEQAHFQAIKTTLEDFEQRVIIRTGKGGCVREHAGLIVGIVQHATSRQIDKDTPPDMQLHSHAMIINTGVTAKGKTAALSGWDFFKHHHELDGKYKAEFAKGLTAMGFQLERTKDGFEIEGVSRELIEHFSKRSKQIEEKAPRDNSDAMERMLANLSTRERKGEYDEKELQRHWNKECLKFGFTRGTVDRLVSKEESRDNTKEQGAAVREAATELSREKMSFTKKELYERTLQTGAARGVGIKEAVEAVAQYLKDQAVKFGMRNGERLYSSPLVKEAAGKKERAKTELDERTGENLRQMKAEFEAKGFRVLGCAFRNDEAGMMSKAGLVSATVSRYLADARARNEIRQEWKEEQRAKLPFQKKVDAEIKYATHQISAKTRDKMLGVYYEPTSKLKHEFLYATHQISKGHRDFLNRELERIERRIDERTIVLINGRDSLKENPTIKKLMAEIERQGGKVIIADARVMSFEKEQNRPILKTQAKQYRQQTSTRQQEEEQTRARRR